jgi:hypothetical protein
MVLAPLALLLTGSVAHGWESSAKWAANVVGYRVNPKNDDVSDAKALAAIRSSADSWTVQTKAAFRFRYDGTSTSTKQGLDGKNLVLFRDEVGATSATARASTYTWKLGPIILETDIVFWDKSMTFVTASMPCSNEIVIENTAIHEFGHALGLDHSTVSTATMWPKSKVCATDRLALDPDDTAGAEALYPCALSSQCDDGDLCTKDTCASKKCLRTPIAGCCTKNAQCDDGDPCTKDTCSKNVCKHSSIAGCCTENAQCDDGDPCTEDTCSKNVCKHSARCEAGAPPADAGGDAAGSPDGNGSSELGQVGPDAGLTAEAAASGDTVPTGETPVTITSTGCALSPVGRGGPGSAVLLILLLLATTRRRCAP